MHTYEHTYIEAYVYMCVYAQIHVNLHIEVSMKLPFLSILVKSFISNISNLQPFFQSHIEEIKIKLKKKRRFIHTS